MRNLAIQDKRHGQMIIEYLDENRELVTIYSILVIILIISSIASPTFRTPRNMFNVLRQAVALGDWHVLCRYRPGSDSGGLSGITGSAACGSNRYRTVGMARNRKTGG